MFGKLLKSSVISKNTNSDNFMMNLSATKKEENTANSISHKLNADLSSDIKQKIIEKGKDLGTKIHASSKFINMINETHNQFEGLKGFQNSLKENKEDNNDKFNQVFTKGLYFIKIFTEDPENKENLKMALDLFSEASMLKKSRGEPYYFMSYIAYLADDLFLAEKYFKISSYLNPDQKYLMPLGRKIAGGKL